MSREVARWTYTLGSRPEGAVEYQDGCLFSNHDTDPAHGNNSVWDLVRKHKFLHLDKDIPEDTPISDRPSQRAMIAFAQQLPEIQAQRGGSELVDLGESPVVGTAPAPPVFDRVTKDGRPFANLPNLSAALNHPDWSRCTLAFDTFRDSVLVAPYGTEEWRPMTDEMVTKLIRQLERRGFLDIAREKMGHLLLLHAKERAVDSAVAWLDGLAWDGTPRIDEFLATYCHATGEDNYLRAVSTYLWTALAGRVLDGGCKADMVPILVGPQGAKKTSAAAALVPDPEYFVEISLEEQDSDLARKIRGRLVGEISELRGLGTRDLEWIKSFITRTHENWIPKYMEFATTFPRRLVFIGTTNSEEFLTDDSGNRRFLPVRVHDIDLDAIRRDRLQLWAEGAARWRKSGIAWRAAEDLAPSVHQQHMVIDSWQDDIQRWLDRTRARAFSTKDVLVHALHLTEPTQRTAPVEKRAVKVLRAMGYRQVVTTTRGDRRRVKEWRPGDNVLPLPVDQPGLDAQVIGDLSSEEEWLTS